MADDNIIEFRLEAVDQFSAQFKKLLGTLGTVGKGILAVGAAASAAAGGMLAIAKYAANLQDEIDALSEKLGLSVKYLSEMRHVAEQMDVPIGSFNTGLQYLTRNIGEATNGNALLAREFAQLGISTRDATGRIKTVEEIMPQLADKFKGMSSDAERARVAMALMGRGGTEMIPMLRGGSEAINKLRQDAEFLGVSMNRQATANASLMNDQINRFKQAMRGGIMATGNELIPIFTGIFNKIANWIAENRESFRRFGQIAATALIGIIVAVQMLWEGLVELWKNIKAAGLKFMDALGIEPGEIMATINRAIKIIVAGVRIIVVAFTEAGQLAWNNFVELAKWAFNNVKAIFGKGKFVSAQDLFGTLAENTKKAMDKVSGVVSDSWKTINDDSKGPVAAIADALGGSNFTDNFKKRMEEMRKQLTMTATLGREEAKKTAEMSLLERYKQHMNNLSMMQEENTARIFYAQSWQQAASLGMQQWLLQQQNTAQQVAALMTQVMNSTVQGIGNAVAQAVVYGQKLSDLMKTLLKQIAAEIISTIVRIGVQQVITSMIGAKTQTAAGIAAVGLNSFASAAAIPLTGWAIAPGIAAANMATASAMAAGALAGIAHGGLDYVPNEATYLLNKGERVLSPNQNQDLTSFLDGSGGGGVNIDSLVINVSAANAASFLKMTPAEWREVTAKGIIPGLDALNKQGVRPEFAGDKRR